MGIILTSREAIRDAAAVVEILRAVTSSGTRQAFVPCADGELVRLCCACGDGMAGLGVVSRAKENAQEGKAPRVFGNTPHMAAVDKVASAATWLIGCNGRWRYRRIDSTSDK